MIERLKKDPSPEEARRLRSLMSKEDVRLSEDIGNQLRVAGAAGLVSAGTAIASVSMHIPALIVGALFAGIIALLAILDMISDLLDRKTIKHNLAMC